MEDFEVRQALAVIKDRVNEIKQEPDWKQKMAEEWNQANEDERRQQQDDSRSQATQSKQKLCNLLCKFRDQCFSHVDLELL